MSYSLSLDQKSANVWNRFPFHLGFPSVNQENACNDSEPLEEQEPLLDTQAMLRINSAKTVWELRKIVLWLPH